MRTVMINSTTFLSKLNLINNYIYLSSYRSLITKKKEEEKFSRSLMYMSTTLDSLVFYVCVKEEKKIRLLPPVVTIIVTITSIHFFVPFSSLSSMTFATSLCHSHPVFLKRMMKKRAQREGGRFS